MKEKSQSSPERLAAPQNINRNRLNLRSRRGAGFTLVELLAVIAIISLLIGLMMPALAAARDSAHTIVCMTRLNQMHTASVAYGNDFQAIPAGRYYENEFTAPQSPPESPSWYTKLSRPWARGPAFITQTMAMGYLSKDKNVAWCPAKDLGEFGSTFFWDFDIDNPAWGLAGSPYGVNGHVFNSVDTTNNYEQYLSGGAIPLWKWDRYPSVFFVSEVAGGVTMLNLGLFLDPGFAITSRPARHNHKLNVLFAEGHVETMEHETIRVLIDAADPDFVGPN